MNFQTGSVHSGRHLVLACLIEVPAWRLRDGCRTLLNFSRAKVHDAGFLSDGPLAEDVVGQLLVTDTEPPVLGHALMLEHERVSFMF